MDIDDTAPVVTRDEIVVRAPIDRVWTIQTSIDGWPSWQPDVTRAEAPATLEPGAEFSWHVAGLDIVSTVAEIDPPRRIVWHGPARGIVGVHVWDFHPRPEGVLVATRESWSGPPVDADPAAMQAALDASLRTWLENLRRAAEDQPRA